MLRFWLALHLTGFMLWMGAGFASMIAGIRGRREDRAAQGAVARTQAAVQRALVAPGAVLTLISGIALTIIVLGAPGAQPSPWLMLMQVAGLGGALLVLFVSLPTSVRLARLDPTGSPEQSAGFDALRARQAQVGSIAGVLGLVALLGGVMVA